MLFTVLREEDCCTRRLAAAAVDVTYSLAMAICSRAVLPHSTSSRIACSAFCDAMSVSYGGQSSMALVREDILPQNSISAYAGDSDIISKTSIAGVLLGCSAPLEERLIPSRYKHMTACRLRLGKRDLRSPCGSRDQVLISWRFKKINARMPPRLPNSTSTPQIVSSSALTDQVSTSKISALGSNQSQTWLALLLSSDVMLRKYFEVCDARWWS